MNGTGWEVMVFVLLPIIFLAMAASLLLGLNVLEKHFPQARVIRKWIVKRGAFENVFDLRDKIYNIFVVVVFLVLIAVTFIYS